MTGRRLWQPLALVVTVLMAASWLATPAHRAAVAAAPGRVFTLMVDWGARGEFTPVVGVAVGVVVALLGWILVLRRRRHATADTQAAPELSFAAALDTALQPNPERSPRAAEVAALHHAGHSVGAIARATRLSQDAVRGVLGAP